MTKLGIMADADHQFNDMVIHHLLNAYALPPPKHALNYGLDLFHFSQSSHHGTNLGLVLKIRIKCLNRNRKSDFAGCFECL